MTEIRQKIRGTTAENDQWLGPAGHVTYDLQRKELRVHDGVTLGGIRIFSDASISDRIIDTVNNNTGISAYSAKNADKLGGQVPSFYAQSARVLNANNGITGGGNLTADRTVGLAFGNLPALTETGWTWAWPVFNFGVGSGTERKANAAQMRFLMDLYSTPEVNAKTLSVGNGLQGGGNLGSGMNVSMAPPATVTNSTANTAYAGGHTHAISLSQAYVLGVLGNGTVYNSDRLGGQLPSYYTDIAGRLGYTPVNRGGDTITGSLTVQGGAYVPWIEAWTNNGLCFKVGDDAGIWDINVSNTFAVRGVQNSAAGYIRFGNSPWSLGANSAVRGGALTFDGWEIWHAGNDGSGSFADAGLFAGQAPDFYRNASNMIYGTLADGRLPYDMGGKRFPQGITIGDGFTPSGGLTGYPSIALGDSDTGLRQAGDGVFQILSNNTVILSTNNGGWFDVRNVDQMRVNDLRVPLLSESANVDETWFPVGQFLSVYCHVAVNRRAAYNLAQSSPDGGQYVLSTDGNAVRPLNGVWRSCGKSQSGYVLFQKVQN